MGENTVKKGPFKNRDKDKLNLVAQKLKRFSLWQKPQWRSSFGKKRFTSLAKKKNFRQTCKYFAFGAASWRFYHPKKTCEYLSRLYCVSLVISPQHFATKRWVIFASASMLFRDVKCMESLEFQRRPIKNFSLRALSFTVWGYFLTLLNSSLFLPADGNKQRLPVWSGLPRGWELSGHVCRIGVPGMLMWLDVVNTFCYRFFHACRFSHYFAAFEKGVKLYWSVTASRSRFSVYFCCTAFMLQHFQLFCSQPSPLFSHHSYINETSPDVTC